MNTERTRAGEPSAPSGPASDPAVTPFVTASNDEIRYAQRLRERLEERYLNRPSDSASRRSSYWAVGAD